MKSIRTLLVVFPCLCMLSFAVPVKDSSASKTTSSAKSTTGSAAASEKPAVKPDQLPDSLVITARLIEIPGKFAPNDLYNYVYIMKYRVVKVLKGTYSGQEILVGHYNPLIPRKQIQDKMTRFAAGDITRFKVGDIHRLVLITPVERVWKDAVEDEYFDSDLEKYYALRADIGK